MPTRAEIEAQIAALIDLGDSPADAEAAVRDALTGTGELTGEVDSNLLEALSEITLDDIAEARLDWYANPDVGTEFKRLLDAGEARMSEKAR